MTTWFWPVLLLAGAPGAAVAGGQLTASPRPPLDLRATADLALEEAGPSTVRKTFAWGGRFVGDLDGDGTDDIALPSGNQDRIELVFGGGDWVVEPEQWSAQGDTALALPTGCRQDDRIHFTAAGDLDGDGLADLAVACPGDELIGPTGTFHGSVLLFFGRSTWGATVTEPDSILRGVPDDAADPLTRAVVGHRVAGVGDVDGDGRGDLVVTGARLTEPDQVLAWVLLGDPDAADVLTTTAAAEWTFAGADEQRCFDVLDVADLGDFDGDGLGDFGLYCNAEPNALQQPVNGHDMAFMGFRAVDLAILGAGELGAGDASFRSGLSPGQRPQASHSAALGDVSGDGIDDFWWPTWFDLEDAGRTSGRVLLGHVGAWANIEVLEPILPPFELGGGGLDHPDGLQLTAAGPLLDGDPMVWLRWGKGADARVGLLPSADPSLWDDVDVPPAVAAFVLPDAGEPGEAWRLGLGGPGDADGDGSLDLLVTGGLNGEGCEPLSCGAAWLVLCRDEDGDGISSCAGDCDDADAGVSPALPEQCDAVDHNCDGDDGQADGDGDGVLGCEGDCDDEDAARFPGAEEACEAEADLDCDGLAPQDDRDEDGTVNCDDCQPWLPTVFPLAPEICDGLDTDCNGSLPRDEQDVDRDGVRACAAFDGAPVDCDDLDPFVHPSRHEDCDNDRDDDCDGAVDEAEDRDADQVTTCQGDCVDTDDTVFPGAEELCDGLDNDCDGQADEGRDMDGDGVSRCRGDCDDNAASIFPGAVGSCDPSVDGNCDGLSDIEDNDGDGLTACGGDCDDQAESTRPEATDWCDRVDNDCDGLVDGPWDIDSDGWASCLGDCDDGNSDVHPALREPDCDDGVDGDCDRTPDDREEDCPVPEPVPPLPPRPLGVSCLDCASSVGGGGGALLALLPLLGLRRRRVAQPRSPRRAPVVILLLALALPSVAQAARKEQAVVLYLSRLPDLRAMTAATKLADGAGISAVEVVHHTELLSPEVGLVVHGATSQGLCPEETLAPILSQASSEALDLLIGLDYEAARALLDDTIDRLPCLNKPLPRRILSDLLYYRGVVMAGLGDEGAAGSDFSRLLAMEPDYNGDPNFPPDVNELLAGVRQARQRQEPARLVAYVPTGARVRVDGVERTEKGAIELAPGMHVVQIVRGRDLGTAVIEIDAGSQVLAIHADDRLRALREVEASDSARAWARQTLLAALFDFEIDLLAVIDLEVSVQPLRYRVRESTGKFSFEEGFDGDGRRSRRTASRSSGSADRRAGGGRAGGQTARSTPASGGQSGSTSGGTSGGATGGTSGGGATSSPSSGGRVAVRAAPGEDGVDRVRVRVGGGFVWVHPFPYGQGHIDASIRLIEGLVVDVGGEAATAGPTPYGLIWLPSASVGLSWRFGRGPVQPRLGGFFKLGFDSAGGEVSILPGAAARLGLDFVPPNARPLVLGVEIQVGVVRDTFFASGGGTLGLRF